MSEVLSLSKVSLSLGKENQKLKNNWQYSDYQVGKLTSEVRKLKGKRSFCNLGPQMTIVRGTMSE